MKVMNDELAPKKKKKEKWRDEASSFENNSWKHSEEIEEKQVYTLLSYKIGL